MPDRVIVSEVVVMQPSLLIKILYGELMALSCYTDSTGFFFGLSNFFDQGK